MQEFKDVVIPNIDPPKNYRSTIGFWINTQSLGTNFIHFSLEHSMIISVSQTWGIYCSLYNINNTVAFDKTNSVTLRNIENIRYSTKQANFPPNRYSYVNIKPNVSGWWFYTRCSVNYDAREMYLQAKLKYGEPYKTNLSYLSNRKFVSFFLVVKFFAK